MEALQANMDRIGEAIGNRTGFEPREGLRMIVSPPKSLLEPSFDCLECSDTGMVLLDIGMRKRAAKRCQCRVKRIIDRAVSAIPKEYGCPRLSELTARPELHPEQESVIEFMKANPEKSFMLCGDNGTGKTFLAYALYVHALYAGRRVVAMSVQELLSQYKRMEMREANAVGEFYRARVVVDDLRQNHTPYTLL